jgi:hypothetical protein
VAERIQYDITNYSFEEFVSFVFDHDPPPKGVKYDPWYFHAEIEFDAAEICSYYVRLFRDPEFLLHRFTKPQLEEGFWTIHRGAFDCTVGKVIDNSDLPLALREECIRSMSELFARVFANESLDTAVQMWWDSLCYDWHCGNRDRARGGEDLQLQDIYFETLTQILAMDSPICQRAALHGLGHLHHPGTPALVEKYLHEHPSLAEDDKLYAFAASKFQVQ